MATTAMDILDTAVKIGLGAFISGFATYYVASLNHSKETQKELRQRKLNIIEAATENVDEYLKTFTNLLSAVDGVLRLNPETESTKLNMEDEKDKHYWDFIAVSDEKFIATRNQMSFAESKLRLIGAITTTEFLDDLKNLEDEVRQRVVFDKEVPSQDELKNWRAKVSGLKTSFFEEIRKHYTA